MPTLALFLAALLAVVHLSAARLRFLGCAPRSRWLSFASGLSVAYVFVHLLPGIAAGQHALTRAGIAGEPTGADSWRVALLGLAVFYGLERLATHSRRRNARGGEGDRTEAAVFRLHAGSYAVYNLLIGYLLVEQAGEGATGLLLFWFAMALHFLVNDFGLQQHHRERYTHRGRWVLAAAVLAGAVAALAFDVGPVAIALVTAFIGGGVVLNVLKEELPDDRESRFGPFAAGALGYAALLALV